MTNAQIIADLLCTAEEDVIERLERGAPCIDIVDVAELHAALDKSREEERKAIE